MGLRQVSNPEITKTINRLGDKLLARIYVLWLIGIFVGALHLKLEKYSVAGIEFKIEQQGLLQGLIFTGVIACYIAVICIFTIYGMQGQVGTTYPMKRQALYRACGKRKSFKGLNRSSLQNIKKLARISIAAGLLFGLIVTLLPLLQIIIFEGDSVLTALGQIFFG